MPDNVTFNFNVTGGGEETPQEEQQTQGMPESVSRPEQITGQPKGVVRTAVAASVAIDAAKQIAQGVASNIGKWTGNSRLQAQVDNANKLIGYGVRIAIDPTPFKIASLSSIAIEQAFNIGDYFFDLKWEQKESERALARMGLGSFRNR